MEQLYTTKHVCKLAEVSKDTACKWAKDRVLKVGMEYLWTSENIREFENRNKQVGRPKTKIGG